MWPVTVIVVVVGSAVVVRLRHPQEKPGIWRSPPTPPAVDAGPPSLAAGALPTAARVAESNASMLHGDSHRTHRARGHGPRTAHVSWMVDVGGAVEAQVTATPDGQVLYVGTLSGELLSIARDGKIGWRTDLGGRVYSAPCIAPDGTVYVGSDAKKFFAISPKNGAIVWSLDTEDDADTGAVIAKDGTIVFAAGRNVFDVRRGGDIAWRFAAKSKIFAAPALGDDGTIYVGSQDDRAYAITAGGVQKWATSLGADVDGAPVIADDGSIFFGTDGSEIVRLESDGQVAWRSNVGGYVRGSLSLSRDGSLIAGTFGPSPREARIDGKNGTIIGSLRIQGTGARDFGIVGGALEDDDGTLYFGAQDDSAYAIARDGSMRWRLMTGGDVDAPLTLLQDGALVVPSDDGKIRLLSE